MQVCTDTCAFWGRIPRSKCEYQCSGGWRGRRLYSSSSHKMSCGHYKKPRIRTCVHVRSLGVKNLPAGHSWGARQGLHSNSLSTLQEHSLVGTLFSPHLEKGALENRDRPLSGAKGERGRGAQEMWAMVALVAAWGAGAGAHINGSSCRETELFPTPEPLLK